MPTNPMMIQGTVEHHNQNGQIDGVYIINLVVSEMTPHQRGLATSLSLTIKENGMPNVNFTIDTTDGTANWQFTDADSNAVAGPADSVTGAPVAPTAVSDTTTVLTAAASVAGGPGSWTAPLTPVGVGTANVSTAALTNSDGSPVLEIEGPDTGQPFGLPASVEVTVSGGAAEGLTMAVTG